MAADVISFDDARGRIEMKKRKSQNAGEKDVVRNRISDLLLVSEEALQKLIDFCLWDNVKLDRRTKKILINYKLLNEDGSLPAITREVILELLMMPPPLCPPIWGAFYWFSV